MQITRKFANTCHIVAPVLIFGSFCGHNQLPENSGEYPENWIFLILALVIMFLNLILLIASKKVVGKRHKNELLIKTYSVLFGTPILIALWILYFNVFGMKIDLNSTSYLRNDCLLKFKNIFMAESRYHYNKGYCPSGEQDSILVTEVYRWGRIKSCGIILDGLYIPKDTADISFLSRNEKEEMFSY